MEPGVSGNGLCRVPHSSNQVVTHICDEAESSQGMATGIDQLRHYKGQSEPQLNLFADGLSKWSDTSDLSGYHKCPTKQPITYPENLKQTADCVPDVQTSSFDDKVYNTSSNGDQAQQFGERTCDDPAHSPDVNEVWGDIPVPNSGWAWLIVAGSFLCLLTVDGVVFSYGLIVHQAITEGQFFSSVTCSHVSGALTGPSLAALSFPGGLFCGLTWLTGPLVGALTNRFGYRPVAMLGAVLTTAACLMCGLAVRSIGVFIVTFGLFGGIGCGLIYLPAVTVVGYWFERHRALVVGLTMCGSGVGAVLLAVAFRLISTHSSWHATFVLTAGLFCQNLVGIALFRPPHIHELILTKRAARCRQASESRKQHFNADKPVWWKALLQRSIRPTIPRGSIMARIIEEKSRQRTTSTGSLDGMVITRNNELVALPTEACEIAIAAASIYAGNQSLSEPKQSFGTAVLVPEAASRYVTVPGAHSQNLETLREGFALSPASSPMHEVAASPVYFTRADVLRTVFVLIQKLQAADLLVPQFGNSTYRVASDPPVVSSRPKAIANYCASGEVHKILRNSGSFRNARDSATTASRPSRWLSDKQFFRSKLKQSPNAGFRSQACESRPRQVTRSRVSSQLTSMVSLDSRTDQFVARELSVLPVDWVTKAAVVAALRAELSRPKYRVDLFYPGDSWWISTPGDRRQTCPPTSVSFDCNQLEIVIPTDVQTQPDESVSFATDQTPPYKGTDASESAPGDKAYSPRSCSRTSFPTNTISMAAGKAEELKTSDDAPPNEFTAYLRDMLDTQLLRKPTFLLMLVACSLNVSVVLVPFHYLPLLLDLAGAECLSNTQWCPTGLPYSSVGGTDIETATSLFALIADESAFASHLATLVVIGAAGIVGRLVAAVYIEIGVNTRLQSRGGCSRLSDPMVWNNAALILCALSLAGLPFSISGLLVHPVVTHSTPSETHLVQYWSMETRMTLFFFSAMGYGFATSISLSLRSVLLVELFGMRHLTNAFGYLLIVQGFSAIIGPTLFGYFCDSACHGFLRNYLPRNYDRLAGTKCTDRLMYAFYACAVVFLLSACLFASLRRLSTLVSCSGEWRTPCCHQSSDNVVSRTCPSPQYFELNVPTSAGYDPQETQTTHILSVARLPNNCLPNDV